MLKHGINIKKLDDRESKYLATFSGILLGETGTAYSDIANEAICLAIADKFSMTATATATATATKE